jgi:GNAT superfamily N-acetyltransferase
VRECAAASGCSVPLVGTAIELKGGRRISIRPLGPADREALAQGFERLGPQSRYMRFFAPMVRLSDSQLEYLTDIDHHDHEALVAVDEQTRDGVGVARYVRIGEHVAEPAVVVADDWQRMGVGALLLDRLADRARAEGISSFTASVLADNAAALALLERIGDAEVIDRGQEVEVRIELLERRGAGGPLQRLLRHTAEETLRPAASFWQRPSRREEP